MNGLDEAALDHVVQEVGELVVEAAGIQKRTGLAVIAELRPGPDLEQFLEGAEPAGQGDEPVREFGHEGLALMHGAHHPQVA